MLRLGIVDLDSSHSVEFTKRLNHVDIAEEQWVEGAKVVMAWAGPSAITDQKTIEERAKILAGYGVKLVDNPEEMIGKVDGVLIESVDGSVHLERARPFLEAGIPLFVDKPFACSLAEAEEMANLAKRKGIPIFSSSSLRYALEVVEVKERAEEFGSILGAHAWSPAPTHPRNPGLFHYGIHGVETLYALMGRGCEALRCVHTYDAEVVVGRWGDGRIGVVRGTRKGPHAYGFTAWCEREIHSTSINTAYIYRELLKRIIEMFQTERPPLDIEETLEIVAFIESAMKSARHGGEEVKVGG